VWRAVLLIGATLLSAALAVRGRRSLLDDLDRRGLSLADVTLRMDSDYWAGLTTTFGKVSFPLFAIEPPWGGGPRRRTPRPARRSCRCGSFAVLQAVLILDLLEHLQRDRGNGASSRNARLAATHSFMRFMEYRAPGALDQIRRVLAIPTQHTDTRPVRHLA